MKEAEETKTEAEEQAPAPQQEPGGSARPALRDDPLSLFLMVAIAILGVMVAYESWRDGRLEERAELARFVAAQSRLDTTRCGLGVAGQAGERLVVTCPRLGLEEAARQAAGSLQAELSQGVAFEEVVLRGRDGMWICPADPAAWTAIRCERRDNPGPAEVVEARERARQRRLERK